MIKLNVPFKDKDLAKSLGAVWNAEQRAWYAPNGSNVASVCQWVASATPGATSSQTRPTVSPEEAWASLPPRHSDPKELIRYVGQRPVKVARGFCMSCDSTVHNEWCTTAEGSFELRHLADLSLGVLRPSELVILVAALDVGLV